MLNNKTILITGGTGSFGKDFAKYILQNFKPKKVIIFSRDEFKQFHMQKEFNDPRLRFFIGDVRDFSRLERAFDGVDIVIHAAALKHVPILEYNPFEAVKTNILGSQNVIEAAINRKVKKVLLISTDKAVHPVNLYGSTKLCAEKLFVSGNSYSKDTNFSAVRYGNVIGSRGSVIETLKKNPNANKVHITDMNMTRFWIDLKQALELVLYALEHMEGGEVFVPKIPSMRLVDLFDAIAPKAKKEVVGVRSGEKIHEILLTGEEARNAVELDKYFIILPEYAVHSGVSKYVKLGKKVRPNFKFSSDTNTSWLNKRKLLDLL